MSARTVVQTLMEQAEEAGAVESVIILRAGETPRAVNEAERFLLEDAYDLGIFQRAGEVVHVIRLAEPRKSAGLKRPEGIIVLEPIQPVALMEILEQRITFKRFNEQKQKDITTDCPLRVAQTYLSRKGSWKLSALAGTVAAPLMREDGSILSMSGFDEDTGLFFVTDEQWPEIPTHPTQEDARVALETLKAPFEEFPFVSESARAVHVAAILTALERRILPACPLFAFSAPAQRSGKSMLAESVAIIATGKPSAATNVSPKREELRKAITSALREGQAIVNLDNIVSVLDSPDLARAITQSQYSDRQLGENKMFYLPTNLLWTATGNNLTFRGDLSSRTLLCHIEPGVEKPEEREFTIPNLKTHLVQNRKSLVVAALTVLRAYHVAGRPVQSEMKKWGGFDEWSDLIRGALVWAGMADPYDTREAVIADDSELETARAVFMALSGAFGEKVFTVQQVIKRVCLEENPDESLRSALLAVAADKDKPENVNSWRLGQWFHNFRGRVLDELRLSQLNQKEHGAVQWSIAPPERSRTVAVLRGEGSSGEF